MRKVVSILVFVFVFVCVTPAQNIPLARDYYMVYDFVDELLSEGVIVSQTAVRPYSRAQVAHWLQEAAGKDSLLDKRQREELTFYMQDFAMELDTMPDYHFYGLENKAQWRRLKKGEAACDFNLSLIEPSLHIMTKDKNFKFMLKPILGMDIYGSKKGMITKRWYGAELQMDICHHLSIWGSLRDNSWKGTGYLNEAYYPNVYAQIDGAKLTKGPFLNNLPGVQYKEANYGGDFSDSRGGISLYNWWGSIGIQRESIRWGDAYHCSNIFSGRNPAVPMVTLQLTPCRWFQFDYFHAWLNSNVVDSTYFYDEAYKDGVTRRHYRPHNKFMAANMFTFTPVKQLSFSFGNSIIYGERNVQAAYFIPIAFYKSLDHLLTKGMSTENQNSQVFASVSVRPVDHLQLYGSFFVDEFKLARIKASNPQNNPISYLVGFNWTGWPVKGLSLKGEFMRSYIACYTHSIEVLNYTSNSYNMGHYMGDNAQSVFVELAYRPVRGLLMQLSYNSDIKYNVYDYIRGDIGDIIAKKPFDEKVWQNDLVTFRTTYEVFQNCYALVSLDYNNCRAQSQEWLNRFSPVYYQGKNWTFTCGLSFSF